MAEFKEVMKKYNEMCNFYNYCRDGCPLVKIKGKHKTDCGMIMKKYPEEAEPIIMAWEKPIDWSKVPVDTKILVKSAENNSWHKRHFAKYDNGKVYAWTEGMTSFTAYHSEDISDWKFAKLAEEGEADDNT